MSVILYSIEQNKNKTSQWRLLRVLSISYTGLLNLLTINFLLLIYCYTFSRYEHFGSDQKRTLINKFVSSLCWTGIEAAFVVECLNIFRTIFKPLPLYVCYLKTIAVNSVIIQVIVIPSTMWELNNGHMPIFRIFHLYNDN